ncbi:MAG: hypothetical protein V1734_02125 [Nanoarchaeota archaeon]
MASTLARWVVEKGIDNIKPSMLTPEMKREILSEAGMIFLKEGRFYEAVKAVSMAENSPRLVEMGDEFMRQSKFENAVLCFIPTKDKIRIEKAAVECAKQGNVRLAYYAYIASENAEMAAFLKENFCPDL